MKAGACMGYRREGSRREMEERGRMHAAYALPVPIGEKNALGALNIGLWMLMKLTDSDDKDARC